MTESFLETLIPFALHEQSQRLVDVASVPKGRGCGCICPSCETPLTARQGQKKRWHFAHLSQGVDEHTQRECHYSLAVSIRLMIRQIARDGLSLMTPEKRGFVRKPHNGRQATVQYRVSAPQAIQLERVEVETEFSGVKVDVCAHVANTALAVFLWQSDRPVPEPLSEPQDPNCGVIAINVEQVPPVLEEVDDGGYTRVLAAYLAESSEGRWWLYHPREPAVRQKALEELESLTRPPNPVPMECVMCREQWEGESARDRNCPRCNTHLFTRERSA